MYCNFTVQIPSEKGKITKMKKGNATYVSYEIGRIYRPEKQYTIPKRVVIGKLSEDDPDRMYPNERYYEYFPEASTQEMQTEPYRSCCLRIGSYIAIQKVLQEYKLPEMLEKQLGKNTGLFLDLVSYLIVDEENAGQYYPDFAFCHPLFSKQMKIYSDVSVSRMLSSISKDQIIGFLDNWNKKRDHKQRIYVSYDSTNKNSQAGDFELVEFGKAKDEKGLPVFNLAIAFDQNNRVPLFYEEYPGSITDVSQFTFMVDKVKEYGYKKMGFILDRGYFSKENIRYMDRNGYEFILMVKGCKALVSSLIEENMHTFETRRDHAIRSCRAYGKTVSHKLYEDDTKNRYFHLYYNPGRQAAEREQLEQKVDKFKTFLEKQIGTTTRFGKTYEQYFDLKYDKAGRLVSVLEKPDVISRELELCGYFCIITSEEMTAPQALMQYRGRDTSEKLFRADKSFIGSKSMRAHSAEAISAKIFVEFVALIVRNRIYNLLKETMLRLEAKANFLTVPAAIRELEKIEMVQRNNGRYRLNYAVSRKQKTILSSFGLSEEDIFTGAAEISELLAKNKSLLERAELNEEDVCDGTDTYDYID